MTETKVGKDILGKPNLLLVPPQLILQVARVREHGDEKYGPDTWRVVPDVEWIGAIARHTLELIRSVNSKNLAYDELSGMHHAAHIATSCGFLLESEAKRRNLKWGETLKS